MVDAKSDDFDTTSFTGIAGTTGHPILSSERSAASSSNSNSRGTFGVTPSASLKLAAVLLQAYRQPFTTTIILKRRTSEASEKQENRPVSEGERTRCRQAHDDMRVGEVGWSEGRVRTNT